MTPKEELHLLACEYASKTGKEVIANRINLREIPLTHTEYQNMWLFLYDGFKAGYEAKEGDEGITLEGKDD